eukprot:14230-Heterococcus_DN1.PRE.2
MPNRTSYDHACVSAYNWGDDKSGGYKAFEEVFTFAYNNLANVTDAPLGLCEGSTVGAGGNKTQWYMDAVDTLKSLPRCCLGLGAAIDALKFTAARTAAPTIATPHSTTQPTVQPTLAVAATGTAEPTVANIDPTTIQPTVPPTTAVAATGTVEPTVATDQTTIQPTVASPIAGLFPMPVGTLAPTAPSTSSGFV